MALAKLTARDRLTLPKSVINVLGPVEYFDVHAREGQIEAFLRTFGPVKKPP